MSGSMDFQSDSPSDLANLRQRQAANPAQSVYVSANAGSGKTKVLVDRVCRLLLAGAQPGKILCLTYTKAAANEMQTRLFERLGNWSVASDAELQLQLSALDGQAVTRSGDRLSAARRLFAQALETPEGLKVQTIHAFCERILRRFPVEAGLRPGFEALDEFDRRALFSDIKSSLYRQAARKPDSDLAKAIRVLALKYYDGDLAQILRWAMQNEYEVFDWDKIGLAPIASHLGVSLDMDADQLKEEAWQSAPHEDLRRAANALSQSGVSNQRIAQIIEAALNASDPRESFELYKSLFYTQAGKLAKRITSSGIADDLFGGEKVGYGSEVPRMLTASEQLKSVQYLQLLNAIKIFSVATAKLYRKLKQVTGRVDFADQIMKAKFLLRQSPAQDWISYKLDGGVDHILLDEAQDTSPHQWDILESLSAEFFALEQSGRTVFAVGDDKQSIYSFQGARPEIFRQRTQRAADGQNPFSGVSMAMSFRSAPHILQFVDCLFADLQAGDHIFDTPPAGDVVRHMAFLDMPGCVELWPLSPAPQKNEDETAWHVPVDRLSRQSSREKLAAQIAIQIKSWIDGGEQVYCKTLEEQRPIRPGDIMILVRQRQEFAKAIIRNLKLQGIAVAGADKLKLTDNIGVQDLISLGRFLAHPDDDLSLAEVLKSPIFGFTDDDLAQLCYDRTGTVWAALISAKQPKFFQARAILKKFIELAHQYGPYDFYLRVLAGLMPNEAGENPASLLKLFYKRLGHEAADPIHAFLVQAQKHQRGGMPSLEHFLADLEGDGSELKREMEHGQDQVRVMTVHGAKGLEAPIVILPDTTQISGVSVKGVQLDPFYRPRSENEISAALPFEGFALRAAKDQLPEALGGHRLSLERASAQEYLRLFYVALTRAQSRLIICGFENGRDKLKPGSWYEWARRGFDYIQKNRPSDMYEVDHSFGTAYGFGHRPGTVKALYNQGPINEGETILPDWIFDPDPPPEKASKRYYQPSHLLQDRPASMEVQRSPLDILSSPKAISVPVRYRRGILIHSLLEILPDMPEPSRLDAAKNYLKLQADLNPDERDQILKEVFTVINHDDFSQIFAYGSQSEVAVAGTALGLPENSYFNAQIDRLAVGETDVWIVDYKSNRPAPSDEDKVAEIYIAQMAAYRALVKNIYPDKNIRCALLWTDIPALMELNSQRLEEFDFHAALTPR